MEEDLRENITRRRQQKDAKPIEQKEPGIRGRNPRHSFQVNFPEHYTRKSVSSGNLRPTPKSNKQFSYKSRIPQKLSRSTDLNFPLE